MSWRASLCAGRLAGKRRRIMQSLLRSLGQPEHGRSREVRALRPELVSAQVRRPGGRASLQSPRSSLQPATSIQGKWSRTACQQADLPRSSCPNCANILACWHRGHIVDTSGDEVGAIRRYLIGALAPMLLLAACATTTDMPLAPRTVDSPNPTYTIGPLDTLNIVVWRNPELSGPVTVRPDGYISMPLIGDLKAAGKSPVDLSQEAKAALSKLVLDPVVSVVVTGISNLSSEQVRIVGEVVRPQALPYRQGMTLVDVMIQAGGMSEFADGNSAILIRGSEGGKQYSIRLKDLLKRGNIAANVAIMPGDIVLVPQGMF